MPQRIRELIEPGLVGTGTISTFLAQAIRQARAPMDVWLSRAVTITAAIYTTLKIVQLAYNIIQKWRGKKGIEDEK